MAARTNLQKYNGEIDSYISNRYRVIMPVSKGGTSEIYKAIDTADNKYVAIKILPQDFNGQYEEDDYEQSVGKTLDLGHRIIDKSGEYIIQEANFLFACKHPNIIKLRAHHLKNERPYIVLDYAGQITLKSRIAKKRMSFPEAARVVQHICSTLDYIHKKGFVYCDIKPSNIMMVRGKSILIDFGLVCPTGVEVTGGTIGYMAPELLHSRNRNLKASPTLDIYSLGLLIYEMLTGFHPRTGQKFNLRNQGGGESPLSEKFFPSPASILNPSISKGIDDILFKCIDENPEHRYQTAGELLEDFDLEIRKLK